MAHRSWSDQDTQASYTWVAIKHAAFFDGGKDLGLGSFAVQVAVLYCQHAGPGQDVASVLVHVKDPISEVVQELRR